MSRGNSTKRRKATAQHRVMALGRCPTSGKVRWDRQGARDHLRRLRSAGGDRGGNLGVYRCLECEAWHVGHR